jgi:hypothetical protein
VPKATTYAEEVRDEPEPRRRRRRNRDKPKKGRVYEEYYGNETKEFYDNFDLVDQAFLSGGVIGPIVMIIAGLMITAGLACAGIIWLYPIFLSVVGIVWLADYLRRQ